MQFRAAILEAPGQSLIIDTVETGPLRPQDVLVRIGAAGICHTDLGGHCRPTGLPNADRTGP